MFPILKVPGDNTLVPGMHTIMADRSQKNSVTLIPNNEYVQRDGKPLHFQLLMPAGLRPEIPTSARYPLVVFVQGAAWEEQDMYAALPQLCTVARAGYVVASVKHRASSEAPWPAFLQDVKSAIRYLRANAEKYHIDPEQVAIWGDSSGGHTAQMVGVTGDMEEFKTPDNHDVSDAVQAVVDFYGPSDITQINNKPRDPMVTADKSRIPEDTLFGGCVVDHPEIAQPGNPINYIETGKPLPPFLVAHGDEDPVVPFNQSVLTVQKLQETDHRVEFYKVVGAGHGTYMWTDEMLQIVIRFLNAWLSR